MDKLDKYHYHEALDRVSNVNEIIENMLIKHPVVQENVQIREHIEKAQEYIAEAYQLIGRISFKRDMFQKKSEHNLMKVLPEN